MFIVLASHGGLRASGFSQRLALTHDTEGEYRLIGKGTPLSVESLGPSW